ncbi:MAG: CoB--CoM heterodisulfide reductase iron-sulfur subunit B family protein [Candidatus Hydrothermales bacterium]
MNENKKFFYYPGCSLKGTSLAYEKSLLAVFRYFGFEAPELPDWNCCGATSYMSIDEMAAFSLAARNLAIAEKENKDIVAPCPACYAVLNKAKKYIEEYEDVKNVILKGLEKIGLKEYFKGYVKVRHALDVIINEIGIENIKSNIKRKLNGVRVFSYYGCLLVRPFTDFDNPRYPTKLDELIRATGAETVESPLKTKCCGGSLTGTLESVGLRLSYLIIKEAKRRGAHLIVTVCPLCQFNLEAYQDKMEKTFNDKLGIPVIFFTQLLGVALEIDKKELGFEHSLIYPDILYQKALV